MLKKQNIAVMGAQWGDEGKGKIVDCLSREADFIVRFHGGNNAGHTVVNTHGTFKMHLIPSGVFYPHTISVITSGVVIDLPTLLEEMDTLKKAGIRVKNRLFISPRAHVIMPYHKILDKLYEEAKGKNKTGTTGRGIGPAYADKVSYMGVRIEDLLRKKDLKEKLKMYVTIKNKIIKALGGKTLNWEDLWREYTELGLKIQSYIKEYFPILSEEAKKGKTILFEGAHGLLLDNTWGTYPYVTASSVLLDSLYANPKSGLGPQRVIGVAKAYITRVGEGAMPTELVNGTGEKLRSVGHEFGSTTGRPRRCGWFDAELLRYSASVGGYTELALTKLDVLSGFKNIKVCVGYKLGKVRRKFADIHTNDLSRVQPIYDTVQGWQSSLEGIKKFGDLPKYCQKYIQIIEDTCGLPVRLISTGPDREALIQRSH